MFARLLIWILLGLSTSLNAQIDIDTIDFLDTLLFEKSIQFEDKPKQVRYTSKTSALVRVDLYQDRRIRYTEIYRDTLLHRIRYQYFEKGEVVKRYDEIHQVDLPTKVRTNIKYPAFAREHEVEGVVLVDLIYSDDCILSDFKVRNRLGAGIDDEVLRVMNRVLMLSKKYKAQKKDCHQKNEPFRINFTLQ